MFMIDEENSEEAKEKMERARKLRNSVGFITSDDLEKDNMVNINNNGYKSKTENQYSNITTNFDMSSEEYQKKMRRARKLRNSVGFITSDDLEKDKNEAINMSNNTNIRSRKDRSSK